MTREFTEEEWREFSNTTYPELKAKIARLRALLIRHHDLACSDQKSGIDFTWTLPFRRLTEDIAAALKDTKP